MRDRLMAAASVVSSVAVLLWVLWNCRYGFDFTDEGFYLVWISDPFLHRFSATQFGFVYHPLFQLVQGNIAVLRQCNIAITFALAWTMGFTFLRAVFVELPSWLRAVVATSIATTSLAFLVFAGTWLPTPSYNSLSLQGLLVALIGMICAQSGASFKSVFGWILLGVGGWIAFMAKPTTSLALGVMALGYLALAGKFNFRLLMVSLASAFLLLLLSALMIDGSVTGFVGRLKGGVYMPTMLGLDIGASNLLRLDAFDLGSAGRELLLGLIILMSTSAYLVQQEGRAGTAGRLICMGLALGCAWFAVGGELHRRLGPFHGMLLFSVPMAAAVMAFASLPSNDLTRVPRAGWALGLLLLALPYAHAFGTGNNYWLVATGAGICWTCAGFVLLQPMACMPCTGNSLLALGLGGQLALACLVQAGMHTPYRQPEPLREDDYAIEVGRPGSRLILGRGFGTYIAQAKQVAHDAGFAQSTPMIDLTGRSPGLLYAMGASNIGQAWTLGGYPGSEKLSAAMLAYVPCEVLARAWVLLEPEGLGKISTDVLKVFGADAASDYTLAGSFMTAVGAGSHPIAREQRLLRPSRPAAAAISACVKKRVSAA